MKKLSVVLGSLFCLFVLAACGGGGEPPAITPTIGTLESPVPLGTTQEVTDDNDDTYTFTITEAYIGQDAVDKAATLEEYGLNDLQNEEGYQYVLVHYSITAKKLSGDKFQFNPLYLSAWVDNAEGSQVLLYGDVSTSSIMTDGTTDGWSAFKIKASENSPLLELRLDVFQDGKTCWFSLK